MFLELSHFFVLLQISSCCYYRDRDKLSETSTCSLVPNLHSECPVFTVSSYLIICNAKYCFQLNASVDIPQETRISECYWLRCGTRLRVTGISFWEMIYSISSELITNGFNLHFSWEKADAEQFWSVWSEFQCANLKPWPVLQSQPL